MFKKLVQQISWQGVFLLVAILIVGFPSLFVNWMIVDDGYYLFVEQKISNSIIRLDFNGLGDILVEKEGGRFRPGLRLYLWLTYLIAGNNVTIHHFINFLISSITVYLVYLIVKKITLSKTASLLSSLLFLIAPFNIENWYRLKTPEPKITFLLAISIFFIVQVLKNLSENRLYKKNYLLFAIAPLIFAYFIREISFAFVPFSVFLLSGAFLLKVNKIDWLKKISPFAILSLIFGLIPLIANFILKQPGSYTDYYRLLPQNIFINIWNYLRLIFYSFEPVLLILVISFVCSWFLLCKKRQIPFERFLQMSFMVGFSSFLVILSPWMLAEGRYLEVALFFFALILGIEIKAVLDFKYNRIKLIPKIVIVFLFLNFFVLGFNNVPPVFNYVRDTLLGQKAVNQLLSFLASSTPSNSKIFWNLQKNEGTSELAMEVNLLMNIVYRRPDIVVEYLEPLKRKNFTNGDLLMTAIVYPSETVFTDNELLNKFNLNLVETFPYGVKTIQFPSISYLNIIKTGGVKSNYSFSQSKFETIWKIYSFQKHEK